MFLYSSISFCLSSDGFLSLCCRYFSAAAVGSSNPQQVRDALQDSQGALYELGVCDDGTFVGLLEEELEESLDTLREMASKLGCAVWVLRKVEVGEITPEDAARDSDAGYRAGEWDDREDMNRRRGDKAGKLWVAEAFVKPIISKEDGEAVSGNGATGTVLENTLVVREDIIPPATEQLKISLTGTTTSGKSTLLGTLTTSQPDNGRGKSRLSLFRHRHELVSGVTSSVAQEIVGYKPHSTQQTKGGEVVNYSYGNISSWTDVHTAISNTTATLESDRDGRIVFLSDTAGHPRYRRTTIRSLVGWAPHYAVLLIPGDENELTEASKRHLQLVLKLGLRLVVLISKIDVSRREGLRRILSEALTSLRKSGREPVTINSGEKTFGTWSAKEEKQARDVIGRIVVLDKKEEGGGRKVVPIVFTSSVSGQGMGALNALLRGLPIPREDTRKYKQPIWTPGSGEGLVPVEGSSLLEVIDGLGKVAVGVVGREEEGRTETVTTADRKPNPETSNGGGEVIDTQLIADTQAIETLFHIEEVYALPDSYTFFPESTTHATSGISPGAYGKSPEGAIVSGHLRYGRISVGDELVVGPFSTRPAESSTGMRRSESTGSLPSAPGKKGATSLTPSNSSLLLASSASSPVGRRGWLSDEEGTGVSSGDEQHHKTRGPRSAMSKSGSRRSGNIPADEEQQQQDEWKVVRVVSVRRLRLPVGTLFEGEAGTVGLVSLGVFKSQAVNDFKTPRIKVQTPAGELNDEAVDWEEGGVSLADVSGAVINGETRAADSSSKPIDIREEHRGIKEKSGGNANETPTRTVSFAIPGATGDEGSNAIPSGIVQAAEFRLRKGMVVLNREVPVELKGKVEWPKAYCGFITEFDKDEGDDCSRSGGTATNLAVGSHVVVYCASIRAAAKVVEVPTVCETEREGISGLGLQSASAVGNGRGNGMKEVRKKTPPEDVDVFGFDVDNEEEGDGRGTVGGEEENGKKRVVAFEFLGGAEWIEVGAKVLVMSGQGGRGLDGVVGRVVRVGIS